ncbi:MAG: ABC transporter substrate-binding protein [Chloroflexi bacterium]|nr:ABC transporter substrate-binding protein [Chloroflexota bacterium]
MTSGVWSVMSCVALLGLVLASCSSAAPPTPAPKATAPPTKVETPAAKPAAAPTAPAATPKPAPGQLRAGGALAVAHFADPISYDPIQESSLQSMSPVIPSYSGIVQHDPLKPAEVVGDLAEKWDLGPDGTTYTFHLARNVKWHDGKPFTSEDARFSLETVRTPPRGVTSPRGEWLKPVDKIEAPDKDTLRIRLKYRSASFLHNLADGRMVMVPKHVFEAKGNMKRDVVGTGPYKFKVHDAGVIYSVVKNPDYFVKGRPYLNGITWYIIVDQATNFAAFRTHRVQVTPMGATGMTPSQSEVARRELPDKVSVDRYSGMSFLAFWMPHTKAPWKDVRVRRAVDMTIDRPKEIKVATEGGGDVGLYMPPGLWSLPEAELARMPGYRQPKDADIAEAKKLLAEAGFPNGFKTTTIVRNVAQHERGATSVKEQLAQIGIDVTLSLKDMSGMFDLSYKRAFDSSVFTGTGSFDDPDQIFGQAFITGVPRNFSEFSDPQFDKWYDEQARELDVVKRKEIVLNMQRRAHESIPMSVLHWNVYELGYWKEVRDLKPGIGMYNNLKFQNVWLDN